MTISSCPDERVLSIYADGEASHEQAAELGSHLAQCPSCSARVAALRVENTLLRDLIEEPAPLPAARPAGSRIQLAASAVLTLGAISLMGAGLALLERMQLPSGFGWLNPLAGSNLMALLSTAGIWVIQGGPALRESLLSLGATMALVSVVGLGLAAWVARGSRVIAAGLALCAFFPGTAPGEMRVSDDEVRIATGEVVEESLIVGAQLFELDGDVHGDLAVAADVIRLRGRVDGNVFAAARTVELDPDARIEGSLFAVGETLEIEGAVRDSSYLAGSRLELAETSRIGRNAIGAGNLLELNGQVGRDASFAGERARLRGRVERDLTVWGADISLLEAAVIGRDLEAWLRAEQEIEVADGAQILGETRRREIEIEPRSRFAQYGEVSFYLLELVKFVAALVVGMLLLTLFPALAYVSVGSARSFFTSAGIGFLVLVAVPIAAVITAITVIGIPLALISVGVYIVLLYLAQLPVAAWIGSSLLGEPDEPTAVELVWPLAVGLILIYIASNLPFIGGPIALLTLLLGLGLLMREANEAWLRRSTA